MRFQRLSDVEARMVWTSHAAGGVVLALGIAPGIWALTRVLGGTADEMVVVAVGGLSLFLILAGIAIFRQRQWILCRPNGLEHVERRLFRTRRAVVARRDIRRVVLARHETKTTVNPFGVSPGSVTFVVSCSLRDGRSMTVFASRCETRAHRAAYGVAGVMRLGLLDTLADEPTEVDLQAGFQRTAPPDPSQSLAHPPTAIGIDPTTGDLATDGFGLRIHGRTPPTRRAAAMLECVLFGGVTAGLLALLPAATGRWWTGGLLGIAILFAGIPFLRVVARWIAVERLWFAGDTLHVDRRILGLPSGRHRIAIQDALRIRMQTTNPLRHGLSILTGTTPHRVGAGLRHEDLRWLRLWLESGIHARLPTDPRTPLNEPVHRPVAASH